MARGGPRCGRSLWQSKRPSRAAASLFYLRAAERDSPDPPGHCHRTSVKPTHLVSLHTIVGHDAGDLLDRAELGVLPPGRDGGVGRDLHGEPRGARARARVTFARDRGARAAAHSAQAALGRPAASVGAPRVRRHASALLPPPAALPTPARSPARSRPPAAWPAAAAATATAATRARSSSSTRSAASSSRRTAASRRRASSRSRSSLAGASPSSSSSSRASRAPTSTRRSRWRSC